MKYNSWSYHCKKKHPDIDVDEKNTNLDDDDKVDHIDDEDESNHEVKDREKRPAKPA